MKNCIAKILLIIIPLGVFISCNAIKRVPDGKRLLTKHQIVVDSAAPENSIPYNLLYLQPNSKLLGIPLQLHVYNLARPDRDSIYLKWMQNNPEQLERRNKLLSEKQTIELGNSLVGFNHWLKRSGEEPSLINTDLIDKSKERLQAYYWNRGWFNNQVTHKITDEEKPQRSQVVYNVQRNRAYKIDSISKRIKSSVIDSLYEKYKSESFIIPKKQYLTSDFNLEQERLTGVFRNSGIFHFEKEHLSFEGDTVNTGHKVNVAVLIDDRPVKDADSIKRVPFKVHTISDVNILPDVSYEQLTNSEADTVKFEGYNILYHDKLSYRPGTLTDAVFITKGSTYNDIARDRTYKRVSELSSFNYPTIKYEPDPADTTGTKLIANVFLSSKEKYKFNYGVEGTHSNIQQIGIGLSTSLLTRNIFRGSELLDISFRGNIGSSTGTTNGESRFFDLQELGADARLVFPRIFFPFNTDHIIRKYMSPSTVFNLGYSSQTNIGLDKTSLTSALSYRWNPVRANSIKFDLLNIQYIRNLDPADFYNVYGNSYSRINDIAQDLGVTDPEYVNNDNNLSIPDGTNAFTRDVLNNTIPTNSDQRQAVRNVNERRERLTENNLIIGTNYSFTRSTQQGIYDHNFYRLRLFGEAAGNVLSGIAALANLEKNADGRRDVLGVAYSQYIKVEVDYIKHWQLFDNSVFAIRTFGGIAIPYGNSNSIPFTRSFFGGGPNDNRAWQAYELGPGTTGGINDFNEANMKISLNGEYRFDLVGSFKGALFVDAGNIWNALDNEDEPGAIFNGLDDLKDLSIGTGFGLRYDFGFFVIRFDLGFKTFDPSSDPGRKWFKKVNLRHSVFNIGINYPF